MKASTKGRSPATGAKRRDLVARISQAHQQHEAARKAAKGAKAEFKQARKAHRQAKQAAKEARRAYKALKKELAAVHAAAKRRNRVRKTVGLRVRKSPPPPFTPLPEESTGLLPAPESPPAPETLPAPTPPA